MKNKQVGGEISNALDSVFFKFSNSEFLDKADLESLTLRDVKNDPRFDVKMNVKRQTKFKSWIKNADPQFMIEDAKGPSNSNAYFICKRCFNTKPIEPGTVIYSENSGGNVNEDYTYTIHDPTLCRTRNYICKNKKCPSLTDDSLKEAVITKNSIDQVVHICTACTTSWAGI